MYIYIYKNDIDKGVASKSLKFADYTKLCGAEGSMNEVHFEEWNDLRLLMEWSEEWQMLFNTEKGNGLN